MGKRERLKRGFDGWIQSVADALQRYSMRGVGLSAVYGYPKEKVGKPKEGDEVREEGRSVRWHEITGR